jgi:hypothetical protein
VSDGTGRENLSSEGGGGFGSEAVVCFEAT